MMGFGNSRVLNGGKDLTWALTELRCKKRIVLVHAPRSCGIDDQRVTRPSAQKVQSLCISPAAATPGLLSIDYPCSFQFQKAQSVKSCLPTGGSARSRNVPSSRRADACTRLIVNRHFGR